MIKTRAQRIAAGAAAAVGIVLGAAGISAAATSTPAPANKPAVQAPATKNAEVPDANGAPEADAGKPDTDNVQEGPGDTTDGGPEVPDANEPKETGSEKAEAGETAGDNLREGPGNTTEGGPEVPDANKAPEVAGK